MLWPIQPSSPTTKELHGWSHSFSLLCTTVITKVDVSIGLLWVVLGHRIEQMLSVGSTGNGPYTQQTD